MFAWLRRLFSNEASVSLQTAPRAAPAAASVLPGSLKSTSGDVTDAAFESPASVHEEREPEEPRDSLLSRIDVLDREQNLAGYTFELREALTDRIRAPGRRARDFIDGLLVEQIDRYARGVVLAQRFVCLGMWDGFLGQPVLDRLHGMQAHLLVRPERAERPATEDVLAQVARAREAGHRIVLDSNEPGPWLESMLPAADAAVFRMGFCAPEEISLFVRGLERTRPGMPVWGWEVSTMDDFELARKVGCGVFSGSFVVRRDDWRGNSLTPHGMRLASLLKRLRTGVDNHEIAEILKHDLALAYRLLRYVNAAAWGLNRQVTSVEQAIMLLGQQPLQRWVSMMLMGSAQAAPGAAVVMEEALVRARFLELLGALRGERDPAAQLFVLGLFSMLDVALKVPLEDAIRPLKLSEPMQDALLRQKGPMAPYLVLVMAHEHGDDEKLRSFAGVLGVPLGELNRLQFEALDWVQSAEG
jgi:EAL and modified HD-GYP domain-containing signal transduction protein